MADGLIHLFAEVHCYRCEAPNLGNPASVATRLIKQAGWREVDTGASVVRKRWHCPECLAALKSTPTKDPTP